MVAVHLLLVFRDVGVEQIARQRSTGSGGRSLTATVAWGRLANGKGPLVPFDKKPPPMSAEPWFKDGLRFQCTGCGDCCTGAPGFVWVNGQEIAALAARLGQSVEEFEGRVSLPTRSPSPWGVAATQTRQESPKPRARPEQRLDTTPKSPGLEPVITGGPEIVSRAEPRFVIVTGWSRPAIAPDKAPDPRVLSWHLAKIYVARGPVNSDMRPRGPASRDPYTLFGGADAAFRAE